MKAYLLHEWENMLKHILAVLLVFSPSILAFASDDQGNPNDPNDNDRANACYEDGSMAGKCLTDWDWEAGWYLIRFEYGLLSRENFPIRFRHLLPALPQKETDSSGVPAPAMNCLPRGTGLYANFGTGDLLAPPVTLYSDANCSVFDSYGILAQVYTIGGLVAANAICATYDPSMQANPSFIVGDVYQCIVYP
jgi:hypothetical protein